MATPDNPPTRLPVRRLKPPLPARASLTTLPVPDTGVEAALSSLVEKAERTQSITALREFPPQPARTIPFPDWVDSRLRRVYESKGISELYTHQARAAERKSLLQAKRPRYRRSG